MKHTIRSIEPDASTFGQLRSLLDSAERRIVVMHEQPQGARQVIEQVDQIDELLRVLAGPQFDTRAEESRAETLHERLQREALRVVGLVQANGQAQQLAASPTWQAIQAAAAIARRQHQRRLIITGSALAVIALLVFVVVPWAFPPIPQINPTAFMQLAANGDYSGALAVAEAERARVPGDPAGPLWVGVLQQRLGNQQAAQAAWSEAQQLYSDDGTFYLDRGVALAQVQEYDLAEADAHALGALPGRAAMGAYLQGQIYEARGQVPEAISAFEQAATLADQSGNSQLTVVARSRVAMLLQRSQPAPTP